MTLGAQHATVGAKDRGLCVLVVEDDEADAYLIERALAGQPLVGQVVRAQDGVEALRMVEDGEVEPDLAFIDLHMPRKNGFNLLAAFAGRSESSFPMVVLTSSTAPTDAVRSRLRGAMRVVTKPESVEAMETVLAFAIAAVRPGGGGGSSGAPPHARPLSSGPQTQGFRGDSRRRDRRALSQVSAILGGSEATHLHA